MKKIIKIAVTELQTLFYSPIAWLILVLFAVQTGITFTGALKGMLQSEMMGQHFADLTILATRFRDMLEYLYLYIPLLTMGLISRELNSGSIKLLYSSPVSNTQIVLGKYLAMLIYGLALTAVLAIYVLFAVFTIKDCDTPILLTSLFGIYLLICIYAAIGLFMSSLTSYQVVAAIGTLAVFAGLNYISHIWQAVAFVRDITFWLSITGRTSNFLEGMIKSDDVLYFVIIIVLFVALTILTLDTARSKRRRTSNILRFSTVIAVALFLGYLTSRPSLMGYIDVTRTKFNTLTPNSQKIVAQLKGPLTITTYVNLFESNFSAALPENINFDKTTFGDYLRFKPDIDMKYVYYYAQTDQPASIAVYPGLTDKQRMERACVIMGLDPSIFLSKQELAKHIDLSGEHYHFVRILETQDGQKAYLRLFNDMRKYPGEREISATLERLVAKLPTVGFVRGHDTRDPDDTGDKGYFDFTKDGYTRSALVNQGFDIRPIDLADSMPIPAEINLIVLAEPKTALSPGEQKRLDDYIARGNNLLIIGDPGRQEIMNAITAPLGVSFLPGRLVQPHPNYEADLLLLRPTPTAVAMSYELGNITDEGGVLAMNGACGLSYTPDKGFTVRPWFGTARQGSWNELQTTNFTDDKPELDPRSGEVEGAYPTVLALSRQQAGRDQRIVVMGDADCLDNAELTVRRNKLQSMNSTFIDGLFFWLSGDKVPIDVRRPLLTDNQLYLGLQGLARTKLFFVWILPGLLAIFATVLLIRRKRK